LELVTAAPELGFGQPHHDREATEEYEMKVGFEVGSDSLRGTVRRRSNREAICTPA
jgi:hypothetical protein